RREPRLVGRKRSHCPEPHPSIREFLFSHAKQKTDDRHSQDDCGESAHTEGHPPRQTLKEGPPLRRFRLRGSEIIGSHLRAPHWPDSATSGISGFRTSLRWLLSVATFRHEVSSAIRSLTCPGINGRNVGCSGRGPA